MQKYQVLEHTADLKIRVFGKDKKELFLNAMIGMFEGAEYEPELKAQSAKCKIKVESTDLPALLVDFLNEALYLSEVNKEVYFRVDFKRFSELSAGSGQVEIEGILLGKKLKRMGIQIKGATYHNLDIQQKKDGTWQATVLFDI